MSEALRLFWYRQKPNFGDRLSVDVVAHVSGRVVGWASPGAADLIGVGSLMHRVAKSHAAPRAAGPVTIWGTGMMGPVALRFVPHVQIAALRGPLTAALLEVRAPVSGDPGLLAADVAGPVVQGDRIGLVLHHSAAPDAALTRRLAQDGRFDLIDVTDLDHMEVVRRIGRCRHVFSSSLHGLIVADSYGVPNSWLDPAGIHGNAEFKFYDYALAIGRLLPPPLALDAIFDAADALPVTAAPLPYAAGIAAARQRLHATFPDALRA